MATARVSIEVRDDAGGVATGSADVTLLPAPPPPPPPPLPPIIDSITLNPTTLPSTGGTVRVTVAAHSPSGLQLTTTATVDVGVIHPVSPGVFDWMVPAA